MTDTSVITNEAGKVIAIVINSTRYSPEAILMLQANTINLEDHQRIEALWKEAAADALQGQEEERRKRIEAEAKSEAYAARVSDAERTIALMVEDMFKRGERAELIGAIINYARDYVNTGVTTSFDSLRKALYEYDELRRRHGRQA